MTIVFSVLLVVLAAGFVVWPLLNELPPEPADSDPRAELQARKLEALHGLKEADFDLRMGKLTDADHALLQQRLRQQALDAIVALDAGGREEGGRREGATESAPEAKRRRLAYCPSCGTKVAPKGKFCGGCGTDLRSIA